MTVYGIEELILLHLKDYEVHKERDVVPFGTSLSGIASAIENERKKIHKGIGSLLEEGLIEKRKKHVKGRKRKRHVYFLTDEGIEEEKDLRESIKDEKVRIKVGQKVKKIPLKEVRDHLDLKDPMLNILSRMERDGTVRLDEDISSEYVFVGRKQELNDLWKRLQEVKRSGAHTVFIAGEAGVGKTRIVSEFKSYALEEGFDFLVGTCVKETGDPYLPFKEAFRSHLKKKEEAQMDQGARIAFMGMDKTRDVPTKKMFDAEKEATFYETTEYIRDLAKENPLLVFLDDLHWIDRASAQILMYMTYKLGSAPVLFVCTYRPEDIDENKQIKEIIHQMITIYPNVSQMELSPLGKKSTERMIKGVLQTKEVPSKYVEFVHEKTEGNPLFTREIVKHMVEEGIVRPDDDVYPSRKSVIDVPEIIKDVLERRIDRLSGEAKKVLDIGSVFGDEVDYKVLSEVVDLDQFDLLDQMDILLEADLWRESPDEEKVYFHNSILRDTVYSNLRGLKKRLLHKQVAEAMEKVHYEDLDEKYPKLAYHYERADEYEKACDYYTKAGERAKSIYAHEDALEMYRKALSTAEKQDDGRDRMLAIREEAASVYKTLGRYDKCEEFLRSILDSDIDKKRGLRTYRKLAGMKLEQKYLDEGLEYADKGLSLLDKHDKDELVHELCKLLSNKGQAYMHKGEHEKARILFQREEEMAYETGEKEALAQSKHDLGSLNYLQGNMDTAADHFGKAIETWEECGKDERLASSLNNLALVKMYLREWDEAKDYFRQNLENFQKMGDILGVGITLNNLGDIYRDSGKLDTALKHFERAEKVEKKVDYEIGLAMCLNNMAITYRLKGELEKALELQKRSLDMFRGTGNPVRVGWVLQSLGDTYHERGDTEKALDSLKEAYGLLKDVGEELDVSSTLITMSEVYLEKDEIEKAREKIEKALLLSKKIDTDEVEGECRRVLGKLCREEGKIDRAEEELDKAGAILEDISIIEYSKVLYEMGLLFLEKEDHPRAEEVLEDASEYFEEIGMQLWIERCDRAMKDTLRSVGG